MCIEDFTRIFHQNISKINKIISKVTFSPRLRNSHIGMADPEVRVTKNAAKGHRRAYVLIVFKCDVVGRSLLFVVVRVLKHTDRYYHGTIAGRSTGRCAETVTHAHWSAAPISAPSSGKIRTVFHFFTHARTYKRYKYTNTAPHAAPESLTFTTIRGWHAECV